MTLTLETQCPQCQTRYATERMLLGSPARCPHCQSNFLVAETVDLRVVSGGVGMDVTLPTLDGEAFDAASVASESMSYGAESVLAGEKVTDGAGAWNVGDVILGTYEVREIRPGKPFASGGLGVVHRVWHREWALDLAVKSPKPEAIRSRSGKRNYEHEALHWLHLALHPNIVSCYMVRRIDNIPRLFAEFVPDGSLWDAIVEKRLYRGGVETTRVRIIDTLIQFAWGLEHAHHNHLLHLDIKPGNVMLAGTTVKVTDFGLAMAFSPDAEDATAGEAGSKETGSKETGSKAKLLGMTPNYCSPEQHAMFSAIRKKETYEGPPISIKSDLWSFAVTAMAMLMGGIPCRAGSAAREAFEEFLKSPSPQKELVPRGLAELLFDCLQRDPAARPASMSVVAERLTEIYRQNFGMEYPQIHPEQISSNIEGLNNSAASLLDLGKVDEATDVFREAIVLQPWHPQVTYNYTLLRWRRGEIDDMQAVGVMESLTQIHRQTPAAWHALALIHRERGHIWGALNALDKGLEIEDRTELERAREATATLVLSAVRVQKQITLPHERFVHLYLSDRENLLLLVPASGDLVIHGILDNGSDMVLTRCPQNVGSRIAISRDYQWEVFVDEANQSLRLCRVGNATTRSRFHQINWQTLYENSDADNEASKRLTICDETNVVVTDLARGVEMGTLTSDEAVTAMNLSRSDRGRWVVTGHRNGTIKLWELPRCRCLRTLAVADAAVDAVLLSSQSNFLLVLTADAHIHVVDLSLLTHSAARCRSPYLLSVMASVEDASRQQLEEKQVLQVIDHAVLEKDVDTVLEHLARLETLPGWDSKRRSFSHWNFLYRSAQRTGVQESVCTYSFRLADQASSVALSANARVVVAAGRDPIVSVWAIDERNEPRILQGHLDWIRTVAMTSNAKFVISGSWDGSVRVWNATTGRQVRTLPVSIPMLAQMALDHRGQRLAVVNELGQVYVWAMATNEIVGQWNFRIKGTQAVCFSRDDRAVAVGCGDGRVCIRNYRDSRDTWEFSIGAAPVTAVALTSDMRYCVAGDEQGRIVTWDLRTGQAVQEQAGHHSRIAAIRLCIDDRWCAVASRDGSVSLHHIIKPFHKVLASQSSPITSLAFDYTGAHLVSGAEDGSVRLRELYWNLGKEEIPDLDRARRILRAILTSIEAPLGDLDTVSQRRLHREMAYRGFGSLSTQAIDNLVATVREGQQKHGH